MNYNDKSTNEDYRLKTTEEIERELQTNATTGLSRKVASARTKRGETVHDLPVGYIINSLFSLVCALILYYVDGRIGSFVLVLWFAVNLSFFLFKKRADNISESLYNDVIQSNLTVIRDGIETEIPSELVVKGDLIAFSAGDSVPFVSYVIASNDLSVITAGSEKTRVLIRNFSADSKSDANLMLSHEEFENKQASKKILLPGDEIISGACMAFSLGYDAGASFASKSAYVNASENLINSSSLRKYLKLIATIGMITASFLSIIGIITCRQDSGKLLEFFLLSSLILNFTSPAFYELLFYIFWTKSSENAIYDGYLLKSPEASSVIKSAKVAILPEESLLGTGKPAVLKTVMYSGEYPLNGFSSFAALPKDAKYLTRCACCFTNTSSALRGDLHDATNEYLDKINASCESYKVINYQNLSSKGNSVLFDYALIASTEHTFYIVRGEPLSIISSCNAYLSNGRIYDMDNSDKSRLSSVFTNLRSSGFDVIAYARHEYSDYDNGRKISFDNRLQFVGFFVFFRDVSIHTIKLFDYFKFHRIRPIILFNRSYEEAANYIDGCEVFSGARICNTDSLSKEKRDFKNFDEIESYDAFVDLSPLQRKNLVNHYEQRGKRVLFVGNNTNDFSALNSASASVFVDRNIKNARVPSWLQSFFAPRIKHKKEFFECDICKKSASAIAYGNAKSLNNLFVSSVLFFDKFSIATVFALLTFMPRIFAVLISAFMGNLSLLPIQSSILFFVFDLISFIMVLSGTEITKISRVLNESFWGNLLRIAIPTFIVSVAINIFPLLYSDVNLSAFSFVTFVMIGAFNVLSASGIGKNGRNLLYFASVSIVLVSLSAIDSIGSLFGIHTLSAAMWICATLVAVLYSLFSSVALKYSRKGDLPRNKS